MTEQDIEELAKGEKHKYNQDPPPVAFLIVKELLKHEKSLQHHDTFHNELCRISRKYKTILPKAIIGKAYKLMVEKEPNIKISGGSGLLTTFFMKKAGRSSSGILNVSVVMRPEKFSCKYNCYFCPNETIANGAKVDMPRSYLSNEDAVRRAADVDFDAVRQIHVRLSSLETNGHPLDKVELRILGGTFCSYPEDYALEFVRDLYYGVNTFKQAVRPVGTLEQEQRWNETNPIHVVGLGLETRPDTINYESIQRFRSYGCTRVEIGVQHTEDFILRKLNRGHSVKHSIKAIRLLKNAGFKVEIHIMTDLPGTTPDLDRLCYQKVLQGKDLIPDYMKDYPCLDVSFTEIKKWKQDGRWKPYSETNIKLLEDVLLYRQTITPKMVRVNRTQRDFPNAKESNDYLGFTSDSIRSDLGNQIHRTAIKQGIYCQCIRCREIKDEHFNPSSIRYYTHKFIASGAIEYFISAEIPRPNANLLLGFIRLRLLDKKENFYLDDLKNCDAMIRELHVYGRVQTVGERDNSCGSSVQHRGIGKKLLSKAEWIARRNFKTKMAIISGIGVRDYYRKRGYQLQGTFMVKNLFWDFIIFFLMWLELIFDRYCNFYN
jgi:ELP3 family radical SAM enzyme/protein acetyltransferase